MAIRKGSGAFKILSLLIENGPMRRADLMQNIMPEVYNVRRLNKLDDVGYSRPDRKTVWKANWGHSFFAPRDRRIKGLGPDRQSLVLKGYIVHVGKERGSLVFAVTDLGIAAWATALKSK
jgi:hypothetical protein